MTDKGVWTMMTKKLMYIAGVFAIVGTGVVTGVVLKQQEGHAEQTMKSTALKDIERLSKQANDSDIKKMDQEIVKIKGISVSKNEEQEKSKIVKDMQDKLILRIKKNANNTAKDAKNKKQIELKFKELHKTVANLKSLSKKQKETLKTELNEIKSKAIKNKKKKVKKETSNLDVLPDVVEEPILEEENIEEESSEAAENVIDEPQEPASHVVVPETRNQGQTPVWTPTAPQGGGSNEGTQPNPGVEPEGASPEGAGESGDQHTGGEESSPEVPQGNLSSEG